VESVDGARREALFPRLVSPHQPLLDLRALTHEPAPGVRVEVRMEGDTFEMEDQRNWSDASFKTYCTPLAQPYPVEVKPGERLRQSVSLTLHGVGHDWLDEADVAAVPGAQAKRGGSTEPVVLHVDSSRPLPLPALGLGAAGVQAIAAGEAEAWRRLGLAHLRADLHLEGDEWPAALETAAANARLLGVPLEIALFLPEAPEPALSALAARLSAARTPVGRWLLFRAADLMTHGGDAALARRLLGPVAPGARFGGGTDRYFTELNRGRPALEGLDHVSFSLNPQVHAFDDCTIFENLGSLAWLVQTARSFVGERAIGLSPVTLRPRSDPRPESSRTPGERPFTDDPRQQTVTAASWTLALLAAAAQAGICSLTLFELAGPRGVRQDGRGFPVYDALAEAAGASGTVVLPAQSQRPERVRVLAVRAGRRTRVFLCNISSDPHPVRLDGVPGQARCAALGGEPAEVCELEHQLLPHSVLRLDFVEEA
jgi:hypothetical protein